MCSVTAQSLCGSAGTARARDTSDTTQVLRRDTKIGLLGLIQSCFEGAMYIFVFMWTPKMEPFFDPLPHGRVFGYECVRHLCCYVETMPFFDPLPHGRVFGCALNPRP